MIEILTRELFQVRGRFLIEAQLVDLEGRPFGPSRLVVEKYNLITDGGKNALRDMILGRNFEPSAIAIGTGSTAPAVTQTALVTEVLRKTLTRRYSGTKKANMQMLVKDNEANGNALREVGLFDSSVAPGGTMFNRIVHNVVNKTSSFMLTYTAEWEIL
jgi:hypothetical protein